PYRNARVVVLNRYSSEEQILIQEYSNANSLRRAEIREIETEGGKKLYSSFQGDLRNFHRNQRVLDYEMDAWLRVFGKVDSSLTPQAEEFFRSLMQELQGVTTTL
ncbi:hypothetical protein LCGC14_3137290, partial [marine sediment metagenome]